MRITKKKWLVFLTLALVLSLSLPVYAAPVLEDNPLPVELAPLDLTVDSAPEAAPAPMMLRSMAAVAAPSTITVTLAPGASATENVNVDIPALPPKADVVFCFDLTGSMGGILNTAKTKAVDIMNQLNSLDNDIDYGVISYMDYPQTYNSFGYSATYGSPGDYAYRLNLPVSGEDANVAGAISSLKLGHGGDGPEDYTRVFFESYSDPDIAWRDGAKHIIVNFADSVPHDNNVEEGISGDECSLGGDPGRNEIMGDTDDLDLQTVLNDMAANHITLLECHAFADNKMYWDYWTGLTGGSACLIDSSNMVDKVVTTVTADLNEPNVKNLHLEADSLASWFSFNPTSYAEVATGTTQPFAVTITVPAGTPEGVYNVCLSAVDENDVNYGDTQVEITVPDSIPPTAEVSYDVTGPTKGNVTASLVNASEPIEITNNGGSSSYTFTDNGTFTFEFVDKAGNKGTATATVDWIDRVAPTAEISYSEVNPTTGAVTATLVNASEPITITNNGGSDKYTFTSNGTFTFEFVDKAGNKGTATAKVDWIVLGNGHMIIHSYAFGADGSKIGSLVFDVHRNQLNQKPLTDIFKMPNAAYFPNGLGFFVYQDPALNGGDIYGPNKLKLVVGPLKSFGMSTLNAPQTMACFECQIVNKTPVMINGTQAGTMLVTLKFRRGTNEADFLIRIYDSAGSAGGNELYRKAGVLRPGLDAMWQIDWWH